MKNPISFENFISQYSSEEWLLLIKNYLSFKSFIKNDYIINEGEKVTGFYFINDGKVKVVSKYDLENERILRLSNSGLLLGHRALHADRFPISAIALSNVSVTFIPKDIFIKFTKANPNFALYLLEFLSKDLHDAEERMKSMIHHEVIIRIGIIICMLIDAYGYDINRPKKLSYVLSRTDFANFAGTTYESIIRNFAKLEQLKLIKIEQKNIIIPSEKALRKFLSDSSKKRFDYP